MQMWSGFLVAICLWLSVMESQALLDHEGETINKCIQSYGGLTPELGERLERFKEWSESYEEIPCFTQCYLSDMFDFYNNQTGFDSAGVERVFGAPIYAACQQKLELPEGSGQSSCSHAYAGFHCLTKMEGHPFMVIESMPNLTKAAKDAMKDCLQVVDQDEWSSFSAFSGFPVIEPIPCYTRCFLDKLGVFDQKLRRWRIPAMQQKLGVPAKGAHYGACHQRRGRNPCATYYQQFTCYVLAV
ncbi:uncharacterized protein LOC110191094 [Drosophila serrata]|uniref:uncharacterized protein LOC110191094 n=1 Tax=Drosophila serrata TaxID=7274 RepID=UPI000A1D1F70|nr:uncharacterized protein LOC110191094 [Drosophila serrata]